LSRLSSPFQSTGHCTAWLLKAIAVIVFLGGPLALTSPNRSTQKSDDFDDRDVSTRNLHMSLLSASLRRQSRSSSTVRATRLGGKTPQNPKSPATPHHPVEHLDK
jgi:hypothetical protein